MQIVHLCSVRELYCTKAAGEAFIYNSVYRLKGEAHNDQTYGYQRKKNGDRQYHLSFDIQRFKLSIGPSTLANFVSQALHIYELSYIHDAVSNNRLSILAKKVSQTSLILNMHDVKIGIILHCSFAVKNISPQNDTNVLFRTYSYKFSLK